jgi:hypothetical protein
MDHNRCRLKSGHYVRFAHAVSIYFIRTKSEASYDPDMVELVQSREPTQLHARQTMHAAQ